MTQRTYRIVLDVAYTAHGQSSAVDLADEIKRCARSFQTLLKERNARDISVNVTAAEVDDE